MIDREIGKGKFEFHVGVKNNYLFRNKYKRSGKAGRTIYLEEPEVKKKRLEAENAMAKKALRDVANTD